MLRETPAVPATQSRRRRRHRLPRARGRHEPAQGRRGRDGAHPARATRWPRARSRRAQPVRRYNQIIGFATQPIAPGFHVHVHNLEVRDFARDYAFGEAYRPTELAREPATFQGIVRPDGRVATRNYIGILSTVNCSATVAKYVAEHFKGDALEGLPQRRRRGAAHAHHRLRHGLDGRGDRRPAAHARRLRAPCQLRRACSSSASAARPTRWTRSSSRRDCARARRCAP